MKEDYLYINHEKIDVEKIVRELYDFSKPGILSIQDVLTRTGLENLLKVASLSADIFEEAQTEEGDVDQEMSIVYFEKVLKEKIDETALDILSRFKTEYERVYRHIARAARFEEIDYNKIGFHKYLKGSMGILPHQDYARHVNLISIFNLKGKSSLFYCKDESKVDSIEIDTSPRSLVLLRAARKESEERYRPFHYLESIEEERLSLNIRTRKTPLSTYRAL